MTLSGKETRPRHVIWKRIRLDPKKYLYDLHNVSILPDGSLHNPNHYNEVLVRESVQRAEEEWRASCSEAAKRAAVTRKRRQELRIHEIAKEVKESRWMMRGPRRGCFICSKRLSDSESVTRGIGPECWERILRRVEATLQEISQQPPAA